jgi:uncharacterized protein YbjT (DUF2867 family)
MAAGDGVVAVLGATGRQGGAVARHLMAGGWHVRAVTRDPSGDAAQRLRSLGAEVVQADMGDPGTLLAAFRGADGVYSVQNPTISGLDTEIAQGRNVGDAAAEAGVGHLVYGSTATGLPGTGVGSWESKVTVAGHLAQLGIPLTILRPTAFMELMTDKAFYPPVAVWHVMPKIMGEDRPVPWLALDDLGAIAAKVFADPGRFAGQSIGLAGDLRSIAECRQIWGDVKGRAPRRFPMPVALFRRFVGDDLLTMWRWLREHDVDWDTETTRTLLPGAQTVRTWVEGQAR